MTSDDTGRAEGAATAAGFAAILLWSLSVGLARSLTEQLGSWTAAAAVHGVSGALALALLSRPGRRRSLAGLPRRYLFGGGVLFVGYLWLFYLGIGRARTRDEALVVGLLNYLWPALTLWFLSAFRQRRVPPAMIPATLLALSGLVLAVVASSGHSWRSLAAGLRAAPPAAAFGLAAGVTWAAYSALTRRWAGGRAAGAVLLFLPATALSLALPAALAEEPRAWGTRAVVEAVALGAATFFAYRGWDAAMRRGRAELVAAASYLTPLLALGFGAVYLGVLPAPGFWIGGALLTAGSFWSWRASEGGVNPPGRSRP